MNSELDLIVFLDRTYPFFSLYYNLNSIPKSLLKLPMLPPSKSPDLWNELLKNKPEWNEDCVKVFQMLTLKMGQLFSRAIQYQLYPYSPEVSKISEADLFKNFKNMHLVTELKESLLKGSSKEWVDSWVKRVLKMEDKESYLLLKTSYDLDSDKEQWVANSIQSLGKDLVSRINSSVIKIDIEE